MFDSAGHWDWFEGHGSTPTTRQTSATPTTATWQVRSGNHKWAKLDTDLYTKFFMGRACDSSSNTAVSCPLKLWKQPLSDAGKPTNSSTGGDKRWKVWLADICAEFNAKRISMLLVTYLLSCDIETLHTGKRIVGRMGVGYKRHMSGLMVARLQGPHTTHFLYCPINFSFVQF